MNSENTPPAESSQLKNWRNSWVHFWFAPRLTLGLHTIRILFGIILLCWLLPFAGYVDDFFGLHGWFDKAAFNEAGRTGGELIDSQSWSLLYLIGDQPAALHAFYWSSIAVLACFTLGIFTRLTGVFTWLIVVSFTANPLIEIDTDVFFRLVAFYLMIGYLLIDLLRPDLPAWQRLLSPWTHWIGSMMSGRQLALPSSAANVTLRLLQVHFALALVMMGLHKLQIAEWWGGVAFWYPLHRPSQTTLEKINDLRGHADSYLHFISLAAYLVVAWQIFFPTFAWRRGLGRWVLGLGALAGMIGLIGIYAIPLMGPVFVLLCLCYLTDSEWLWLFSPLQSLLKSKN